MGEWLDNMIFAKGDEGQIDVPSRNGTHPQFTAGKALQALQVLSGSKLIDKVPYVFRKSGSGKGLMETEKMIGVSVPWNQLGDPKAGSIRGVTITVSNGKITWSGTASSSGGRTTNAYNKLVPVVSGHKYICMTTLPVVPSTYLTKNSETSTYFAVLASGASVGIAEATFTGDAFLGHSFVNGTDYSGSGYIILTDLTLAFNPAIADYIYSLGAESGVAKLREWGFFDKPYYAYNAGGIESVNVSKHRMTGLNQFDKSAATDGKRITNANVIQDNANYCVSDYIPVIDTETYYVKNGVGISAFYTAICYDGGKNFIGVKNISGTSTASGEIQFLSGTRFVRLNITLANKDAASLSISNPAVNGTYEPYKVHEYPIADITLRGILKLDGSNNLYADGDVYESDGTHTSQFMEVTYDGSNDEGWVYENATNPYFRITVGTKGTVVDHECRSNSIVQATISGNTTTKPAVDCINSNGFNAAVIFVRPTSDGSITDVSALRTWLSNNPLTVIYKLVTPTTETVTGFTNPQVCSPYGTEEYVDRAVAAGTRDVSIPCGHETEYDQPVAMLPDAPSSNGNYRLRCTVASGVPTYSWVSE